MSRKDLLYREIDQKTRTDADAAAETEAQEFSYLNDRRLDSITEKVIQFMDETPVSRWENEQWGLFKLLWTSRKTITAKKKAEQTPMEQTTEELQKLIQEASTNSAEAKNS